MTNAQKAPALINNYFTNGGAPISSFNLAQQIGRPPKTVARRLEEMRKAGKITSFKDGKSVLFSSLEIEDQTNQAVS